MVEELLSLGELFLNKVDCNTFYSEMYFYLLNKDSQTIIRNFKTLLYAKISKPYFLRQLSPKNSFPQVGASVSQWVKPWPSDLAVMSSSSAGGEILSMVNGVPLHTAFHYQSPIVLI